MQLTSSLNIKKLHYKI